MLENIKMLLDITDTSQDDIINYYISALQKRIVNICELSSFPDELSDLIIDIVVKKMKNDILEDLDSVKIGDTNIKVKSNSKTIIDYLNDNMSELEKFMYVEVI